MGNPVEDNFITRFILGFVVIFAMMIGGGAVSEAFSSIGIPYGDWIGVVIGALVAFAIFVVLYRRYDAAFDSE